MCSIVAGTALVALFAILYILGLYLQLFVADGYEFLITMFVLIVLVGTFLDQIINVFIQKREFFIIDHHGVTVGHSSLLGTTQETYPLTQSSSMNIHFQGLCFEVIELYLFSEKILIEKSALATSNYEDIKSSLQKVITR